MDLEVGKVEAGCDSPVAEAVEVQKRGVAVELDCLSWASGRVQLQWRRQRT